MRFLYDTPFSIDRNNRHTSRIDLTGRVMKSEKPMGPPTESILQNHLTFDLGMGAEDSYDTPRYELYCLDCFNIEHLAVRPSAFNTGASSSDSQSTSAEGPKFQDAVSENKK